MSTFERGDVVKALVDQPLKAPIVLGTEVIVQNASPEIFAYKIRGSNEWPHALFLGDYADFELVRAATTPSPRLIELIAQGLQREAVAAGRTLPDGPALVEAERVLAAELGEQDPKGAIT